jgi:hypothetical protein
MWNHGQIWKGTKDPKNLVTPNIGVERMEEKSDHSTLRRGPICPIRLHLWEYWTTSTVIDTPMDINAMSPMSYLQSLLGDTHREAMQKLISRHSALEIAPRTPHLPCSLFSPYVRLGFFFYGHSRRHGTVQTPNTRYSPMNANSWYPCTGLRF